MTTANRAYFGIQHVRMADCWMNDEGNLQGQIGAIIFDTREEAQLFLDSRRLRRGFRQNLAVAEIAAAVIRDMERDARGYSATAIYPAADHRPYWAGRADYLAGFLPLAA